MAEVRAAAAAAAGAKTSGMKCVVVLKSGGKILGGQRGATLNRSAETIDVTTKDGDYWSESVSGFRSFSIDCDGAYIQGDESLKTLNEAFENGTAIEVIVYMNVEIQSPGPGQTYTAKEKYEGKVIVTEFSYDLPYDDLASYSMTLQGTGKLTSTFNPGE